tara:strand:- start:13 stop:510 length:498 start_codon:yes stop_codon:yes gene_type:complete
MEKWKDIKGYEGFYQVSDIGRVKSLRYGNILKTHTSNNGYMVVNLSANTRRAKKMVHTLVAESFLNHKSTREKVVDHINNIKIDNNLSNLQIISHRENCSKDKKGYLSKYVGVAYNSKNKKWVSMISVNTKSTFLGSFESESRASIAYKFALTQLDKLKEYNLTR